MPYTIEEIKSILTASGQIVSSKANIEYLLTDSRSIIFPGNSLFIAIKGKHFDGHKFISQAYNAGVRNFIAENTDLTKYPDANILLVENSVLVLQQLAAHHRNKFSIDVIGITGSNGKTIVKEWIYHLLRTTKNICRNPKSYNSQIGVPLSVWQLDATNDLAIFEAGISQPGEMENLEKIIQPTIGVFTNIGPAHDEGFSDIHQKIAEKLKLFSGDQLDVLFYCADYPYVSGEIHQHIPNAVTTSWSKLNNSNADIQVKNIRIENAKTIFDIHLIGRQIKNLEIPFIDDASFENAVCAIIVADNFGIDEPHLRESLTSLPVVSMRLELKKGINNCFIINDVYSSDIASLEIALHFLQRQKQNLQTHVILSDIDESGVNADALYKEVAQLIDENKIQYFTGIGEIISAHAVYFESISGIKTQFYSSAENFIHSFGQNNFHSQFILLKGARRFRLERISNLLSQKTHGTVLQINLNHLVHNLNVYRALLHPGVQTMAMVKAFSYGSGTAEIASVLASNHVDYFAVAYADEGIELRKNGIHLPVMVMNPEPDTFEHLFEFNLEPEIYNLRILKLFVEFIASPGSPQEVDRKIHLKIDTGMHRLGFDSTEVEEAIEIIKKYPSIKIASVFSHLAAADEEKENDFTKKQIQLFDKISKKITTQFDYPIIRHILNSPGISKFSEGQFDMVRLGIGLYGDDPSKNILKKLLPVSYLFTTVSQIKNISAGESIGYGRSFYAEKNMRIATLNIGYADGFSRRLSNGIGKVFINGNDAPVVGKVCMDMIMVDVTNIQSIKEGDIAEIFGEHISLHQYAVMMQTIPYEILTGISQRVKRVYVQE
ncbi:MAG: bifunctional UDP-N-acetylmuramoyl-tripeptide:D-alanyl-D-alanine ligase/alanine racemase [Fimbriimonadaceae bacterium]|nr:bifunctional UDP-N-acetylmuramoyl-tripeptide:D-alanyl-D-alanine ligase/alanine racemase [Chitinophagales bacterium]